MRCGAQRWGGLAVWHTHQTAGAELSLQGIENAFCGFRGAGLGAKNSYLSKIGTPSNPYLGGSTEGIWGEAI